MVDLPQHLLAAIKDGRVVLFLGAGASRGAKDSAGRDIPDAKKLAEKLTSRFLDASYESLDLKTAYDYAAAVADVRTVQKFIYDELYPFEPAPFHKLIPTLPWAGLVGTNYDLVVERSYSRAGNPLQRLNVVRSDKASVDRSPGDLTYIKLHGCITEYQVIHPPLVASTEQLISFREGRVGQFDTFLEWAKRRTIVFAGYSFADNNLRTLLDQVIREGDGRPTHYIVGPGVLPAQRKYWADRRIDAIDATFEAFLSAVDAAVPPAIRELSLLSGSNNFRTPLTSFISVHGRSESPELRNYLSTSVELVADTGITPQVDAKQFYRGFDLGWSPIANRLDVRLPIVNEVMSEEVLPATGETLPRMVALKGHAGSGKSVAMRRICYEAAVTHRRLCIFVSRLGLIDETFFDELFSLTSATVHLFIDNASYHRHPLRRLFDTARKKRWKLFCLCSESYNLWNTACENLAEVVSNEYTMRYLSETDIDKLLECLSTHNSLGYLEKLPHDKRKEELKEVHGRQILVALLEATHGVGLQQIVVDEYNSIAPPLAKQLYLDICALHRLGPSVRAGLISRVHNISFDEFEEKLFKPLEGIVRLRKDARSGDYVFEARHSEIASVLYDLVQTDPNERFDTLVRIVTKLNPSYSYDIEALSRIIRADNVRETIPDEAKAKQLYDAVFDSVGRLPFVVHQRGVYEMQIANTMGRLEGAQQFLLEALELEDWNRSIQHSLAELDLKRSRIADDPLERVSWRRSAERQAIKLTETATNAYPHHTLLKAALDELVESLHEVEETENDAAVRHLSDSVTGAENALRRALQRFPNDARLLAEEGRLSEILAEGKRAERAFERAFEANPRSRLIANRLYLIKKAKGDLAGAVSVLRKALEHNPSSREINFDLALSLMDESPNADQANSDEIAYFLRRSFSPGDKQYQAQFWYARQLSLRDKFDEAKHIFDQLANAPIPFKEKTEARGTVRNMDGTPRRFVGVVSAVKSTYGFVKCEQPSLKALFLTEALPSELERKLSVGRRITFSLAFTLRGAVATDLQDHH